MVPWIAKCKSHTMVDIKILFLKKKLCTYLIFPQRATSMIPLNALEKNLQFTKYFCVHFLIWLLDVNGISPSFFKWRCPDRWGDLLKVTQLSAAQVWSWPAVFLFTAAPCCLLVLKTKWKLKYYPGTIVWLGCTWLSFAPRHPLKCDSELGKGLF